MNTSTNTMTSPASTYNTPAFWNALACRAAFGALFLLVIAYIIYGTPAAHRRLWRSLDGVLCGPPHADPHRRDSLRHGRAEFLWFAPALRTTLADAGRDGWGAAGTASSAALGVLFLLLIAMSAALASRTRLGGLRVTRD